MRNFLDRMAAGKAAAEARRSRGLHTGRSAKGWAYKASDHAHYQPDAFDDLRHALRSGLADIRAGFRAEVLGEQWGGL